MTFTFVTLLLLPLSLCNHINVTQLPNKPGIHFEEIGQVKLAVTNWNFIVYFNLEPFNKDLILLRSGLAELRNTCTATGNHPPCAVMTKYFQHIEEDLQTGSEIIATRKKRGAIDIIGNVANSLFGVLDSNYEQKMSKTIAHIQGNEAHLVKLLKNQTSLIDSTINVIKHDQANVKFKFDEIDARLNELKGNLGQGPTSTIQSTQTIISFSLQLMALSSALTQARSSMLDVLIDSHHGKVNPHILTPHQLSNEIEKIRIHLPPHLQLPAIPENILQYYQLMEVDGVVAENHIIFTINLPLLDQRTFHLHHLTPITAIINNTLFSLSLSTTWLAINDHRDEFFIMTEKTIESCSHTKSNIFLCSNVQSTLRKSTNISKCELDLFNKEIEPLCEVLSSNQSMVWYQLYDKNKWIYTTKEALRMTMVCSEQSNVTILSSGTGILEVEAGCTIKGDEMTIHGHQFMSTTLQAGYTSSGFVPTNSSKNFVEWPSHRPYEPKIDELTQIQNQLSKQQEFNLPMEFQSSVTHSLGIAYVSLGVAACISLLVIANCYWQRRNNNIRQIPPPKPPRATSTFDISTI